LADEGCVVNLAGDYRYLSAGYDVSQDLELAGEPVPPGCQEILDAYITPSLLEKARLAGLRIPIYYVTNDHFEPPVIVDSLNPFMERQRVVRRRGQRDRVATSLTRNFTYAICCQELPPAARIGRFRAILGWSLTPRYRALAGAVWRVFRIPLAVVRVIVLADGAVLLSRLQALPLAHLSPCERRYLRSRVTWRTSASSSNAIR
jgi:hypothetical protein